MVKIMRPKDLSNLFNIVSSIPKNCVLIGPPGIGKTVAVEDFALSLARSHGIPLFEAEDVDSISEFKRKCPDGNCVLYVYLNVNTSLPVDISGIPEKFTDNGETYVRWVPLNVWLACRYARYCIVFIDEFNTVENPDMQAAVMRMLGECRAGNVHLGCGKKTDGFTIVVAAGNPPTHSSIAQEPPAPLMGGKVIKVNVEPPTLQEWIIYMHDKYGGNWCPRIASFLAMNPTYFAQTPPEARTINAYPTPRGWDSVARLCGPTCDCKSNYELIEGLVGPEAATALIANFDVSPTLDDVIFDPNPESRALKFIAYMATRYCLDNTATEDRVAKAIEPLDPETIAAASFVAAPQCPKRMTPLHRAAAKQGKVAGVLRERWKLTDRTLSDDAEVLEELL